MAGNFQKIFDEINGLDEKSKNSLIRALEQNNLKGFDYLEFRQSLQALTAMQMDESTSYKSAFATASTMGLTKDKLLKTAEHYKQILSKEKGKFDQALQGQIQQRISGRQEEAKKLAAAIKQHEEQILKLKEKIKAYQGKIDNSQNLIDADKAKIEQTRNNFESTYTNILSAIESDIQKINNLL